MSGPIYKAHSASGLRVVTDPAPYQPAPTRRRRSRVEPEETALRLLPDGSQEEIPVTREILLNPCPEIQILHSDDHFDGLDGLIQRLRRFVERRPGWRLFSDVSISWPQLTRNISPDVSIAENVPPRKLGKPRKTLDVAKEGCRVRVVIEVVSEGPLARWKDVDENPSRFARAGVDDHVLVYLPNLRKPEDPPLLVSSLRGRGYREVRPDAEGRYLLASVGVLLTVEGEGLGEEVVAYDAATGERLTTAKEEAVAREEAERQAKEAERQAKEEATAREEAERQAKEAKRQAKEEADAREEAERQAKEAKRQAKEAKRQAKEEADAREEAEREARETLASTLLRLLGNRGLAMSDEARKRIESCRDLRQLEQWIGQAFSFDRVDDLFDLEP